MSLLVLFACAQENDLAPAEVQEYFNQGGSDQVDVLWVVDNSVSMAEEQGLVASGVEGFLASLSEEAGSADLHIGVVTTDIDESNPTRGQLIGGWLTGEEPDFADQFRSRVRVGTDGSDMEQGLGAAWLALSQTTQGEVNEGFLRKDANLALIFVSDENDCSNGGAFPEDGDAALCYDRQDELVPLTAFVHRFAGAPIGDGRVIASAIAGPEASAGCETATPGHRYMTAADALGGVFGSVCEADYGVLMDEIARQIIAPARVFPLENAAQEDTLIVVVDGETIEPDAESAWWYDAAYASVRFDGAWYPPPGSEVFITYLVEK